MPINALSYASGRNVFYKKSGQFRGFIGTSPVMQEVYGKIENAARSKAPAFISGEIGTGKKVCAESIHKLSGHAHMPFIVVNCAVASDFGAVLYQAEGGTVLLDEVTGMSRDLQLGLLQFLKSNAYEETDIRIICTTRDNAQTETAKFFFRPELYYHLHVLPITMPPLRARGEDVLDIALTLLRQYAQEEKKKFMSFNEEAEFLLSAYHWPGNVRELQNVIKNIVVMHNGENVMPGMLPPMIAHDKGSAHIKMSGTNQALSLVAGEPDMAAARFVKPLAETEREAIEYALSYCSGNITNAASLLDVAPSTIYRKKAAWDNEA